MLFHVTHTHSWETCPYNDPDMARATLGRAMTKLEESDVAVVGAYVDPAAHTTFLILDAESVAAMADALAPIIDIGSTQTRPVAEFADIVNRLTGGV